ncbi:MAG: choice-of-anchor B family protein [Saprospiraceae bacterium]|nr:choice-of-anchor B family protein [Saprospiraceae bacterium]
MTKLTALCLALFFGFQMFAQDSLNMKKMGELSGLGVDYNDIWGYRKGTKEFGVIGSNSAINIVDVTDCGNPVLAHQWVDGSSVIWRDFKEYGDYIYAVCDGGACNEGLQVINKNTYAQSQSLSDFRSAHNIFLEKKSGRLYVAGSNTNSHGLWIYDVKTDPGNPILLKNLNFRDVQNDQSGNYYVHDLYVLNDTAYCSHGYVGYRIWDITDVNNVSLVGELDDSNGYNHSSWRHATEPYMYVAEEVPIGKPIYVYDISDIENPFTTYSFKDPLEAPDFNNNRPHNPFVLRDRLYISYYHDGIQVYDISDPELPDRIAYYDTYPDNNGNGYSGYEGSWGVYPYLPSGCILAADITYGLNTLELTITPDSDNSVPSDDIIIDNENNGIVFRTPDEEYVRITINAASKLESTILGSAPTDKIEFGNSNLNFPDSANGVIMKSPNNEYFRLGVDDAGSLELTLVSTLPSDALKLSNEDIFFANIRAGIKMKSNGGFCYIYTVGDGGVDEITSIDCD